MKKLRESLAIKIVAVILFVLLLIAAVVSAAGAFILAQEGVYLDGGKELRNDILTSLAWREIDGIRAYLELKYGVDRNEEAASDFAELYTAERSNLCITVEDSKGKTVYENTSAEALPEVNADLEYSVVTDRSYTTQSKTFPDEESLFDYLYRQHNICSYSYDTTADGLVLAVLKRENTKEESFSIHIGVRKELTANDSIARGIMWLDRLLSVRDWLLPLAVVFAVLIIILFVYLLSAAGHKAGVDGIHLNWVDRIPFDLYLAILTALFILGLIAVDNCSGGTVGKILSVCLSCLVWLPLLLSPIMSFAARVKHGAWWRNTVIYYLLRLLKRIGLWLWHGLCYVCRALPLYWKTALIWTGLGLLELCFLLADAYPALWVAEKLLLTPFLVLVVINLRKLQRGAEHIAAGELQEQVELRHMLPVFRAHGQNLNSINEGMKREVEKQMRSERMKAELITNVSHDIKTPLTSIINYVDLLQKEGLDAPSAPEYLSVLERQSARLKKLTEDLIEASKASTGNIAVNAERTDLHVLLSQATAEYAERLQAQGLETVMDLRAADAAVYADGRLLWRVFDNLLSNISKYALPGTRVYVQTQESEQTISVFFKNISASALNISSGELMERFVRGDASRNTEGSGLGLSIARSLTELQGGQFTVEIDGDLFKVIIELPKMV